MSWTVRLLLEAQSHKSASFITLTYAETNLPQELEYRDIQLFLKRLRKSLRKPIRFFCTGEYGTRTKRPHWHMMIFNMDPPTLGLSHLEQWPHGFVHFGQLTPKTCAYVAKYSLKSAGHVVPSETHMSLRPGLGQDYIKWLASYYATRLPSLPEIPHRIKFGKDSYPLDRTCRQWFEKFYLQAGGAIDTGRSALVNDCVAVAYSIFGNPDQNPKVGEYAYEKALIAEQRDGQTS